MNRKIPNSRIYNHTLVNQGSRAKREVLIEVSARHVHLSQKDLEALFNKGYQLKKLRELTHTDEGNAACITKKGTGYLVICEIKI